MALSFRNAKKWMTRRVIPDYTNQLDLFSEANPEEDGSPVDGPSRLGSSPAQGRWSLCRQFLRALDTSDRGINFED